MKDMTNYVVGVGPIGLITAKTLVDSGERVVLIAPNQNLVTSYSARNLEKKVRVKRNSGETGGAARNWDFQCTRISEKAFEKLEISNSISYLDYLISSEIIERLIGIKNWPSRPEEIVWKSKNSSVLIRETFSVIAEKFTWDEIFQPHLSREIIDRYHDEALQIVRDSEQKIRMKNMGTIEIKDTDRVFLANGTIGTQKLLRAYSERETLRILPPKDHPSMYAGRITNPQALKFRQLIEILPDGTKIKLKFKVENDVELGIFELRERWPKDLTAFTKRFLNLLFRFLRITKRFLPELHLWIQLAQSFKREISPTPQEDNYSHIWTATIADFENYQVILESAEKFLSDNGMHLLRSNAIIDVKDLTMKSEEAFHPSGILGLDGIRILSKEKVYVLGAAILGNVSWNNPTIPAMAISRILTISAINETYA